MSEKLTVLEKNIVNYINEQNDSGNKPDSVGISSAIAKKMDVTMDIPYSALQELEKKGVVNKKDRANGFNGNSWYQVNS